ncbi:transposase [Streptomyces sp. NPDC004044]
MSDQLTIPAVPASTTVTPECDCYVHRFGSIAPGQRARCYPSDMTDAEWAEVRTAMPVPAWLLQQGGRPEAYCHREMLDAMRYLVDNGSKWMAMPVDFLQVTWNLVPQDASRILRRSHVLRRSVGQRGGTGGEVAGPGPA